MTPNSIGNMQKHVYLGYFHAVSIRGNTSGFYLCNAEVWKWKCDFIPRFGCNDFSMLGLKLSHVIKRAPGRHKARLQNKCQFILILCPPIHPSISIFRLRCCPCPHSMGLAAPGYVEHRLSMHLCLVRQRWLGHTYYHQSSHIQTLYSYVGGGWGLFLRWWSPSVMWAGPLIYLWPPPGMSE